MAKTKLTEKAIEALSYEEASAELESIVGALEEGQNMLEDALKLFERGQALAAHCGALLESAQLKVQKLSGESLIPFEADVE
ncbi:MAG: exodeoxyribonuclease VII small subunit [Anaerolineales bacterium]|nr:exodeoxyribonuclease VII small subunit [Anaerolineales bacterium]MCZ2121031.1 exodeoxyribonuclease VII small subunit [Anaerolineales bacterium]